MESVVIDGNNVLAVYDTVKGVRDYCIREQKPYLIECLTFRMRGHEEASGTKYVPKELVDAWQAKDPIKAYEGWLVEERILSKEKIAFTKEEMKAKIEAELKIGFDSKPVVIKVEDELRDMYLTSVPKLERGEALPGVVSVVAVAGASTPSTALLERGGVRFIDAIREGLHQSMQQHANLILMGQDIAEYGGAFKITEGFVQAFGKARVRNTPLCESAILGAALGLSLEGFKSMMEMQFADFVTVGFNQSLIIWQKFITAGRKMPML